MAGGSSDGPSVRYGGAEIRRVNDASRNFSLGWGMASWQIFWQMLVNSSPNAFSDRTKMTSSHAASNASIRQAVRSGALCAPPAQHFCPTVIQIASPMTTWQVLLC